MRPRWIDHDPDPKDPRVGTTIIASWWPWVYCLVSTVRVDGSSHLARLMSSIENGTSFEDAPNRSEKFVTQVVHCSRLGVAKSWDRPLHEEEYDTLEEARLGHQKTVEIFAGGSTR